MIITLDISQIVYNTGVSRYTKELVRHLLRIDKQNHYKLFAGTFRQKQQIQTFADELNSENSNFEIIIKTIPPKLAQIIWNKWHIFPIENFVGHTDIFHTSDWTQPPTRTYKKITTVHDLTPLIFPQYHEQSLINNFKHNLKLIEKECDHIICVSKSTQQDLLKFTNIDESKTSVIYNGVGDNFQKVSQNKIDKVRQKFSITKNYILSVATLEPRKNIKLLIQAFQNISKVDDTSTCRLQLVLTGKYGWGDQNFEENQNIIKTGFVDDQDLLALYSGASLFAYPSLYEGFGFPVVEAIACDCPVLTSNLSSLPEVTGDAAILVNPNDIKDIEKGIMKMITDKNLTQNLSAKGLKQAQKFSWDKCAYETLKIYEKIYI